jgi:hypothetical protein
MPFFWCTDHHAVEDEHGCRAEVRLGPYPTREAAERALQSVQKRNEELDAEDEAWLDGD